MSNPPDKPTCPACGGQVAEDGICEDCMWDTGPNEPPAACMVALTVLVVAVGLVAGWMTYLYLFDK